MNHELKTVLQELGLIEKIEELGLDSSRDILSKSVVDLQKLLQINESSAYTILRIASQQVFDWRQKVKPPTFHDYLTTGDSTMDQILGGGICPGMLTEIVGESSSGKTQLGLQLCLTVQKALEEGGLEGAAVYIHTEGLFPSSRLDQLVTAYPTDQQQRLKAHIHTMRIKDSQEQYRALIYQLPAFVQRQQQLPIRLVVIDSISSIYRSEPPRGSQSRYERMREICEIGTRLKKLASEHHLAVVAINQVADNPTDNQAQLMEPWMDFKLINSSDHHMIGLYIQSLLKKPVLGLSWSNSVNTRIRLARSPMIDGLATRRVLSSVTPHDTVHPKKQVIRSWKDLQQDTIDDIHKTVRQLPLDNVLPLLKELLDAFDKDATARDTTEWLKIVLLTHTAYFMSLPDIVQRLSNVYKELEDRLTVYPKLLAMHGRLDLVQNQVDARHLLNHLAKKVKHELRHAVNHIIKPHENEEDDREEEYLAQGHRYDSFAPIRHEAMVKYFVDGHDYCWAVSEAIEGAKEVIFIEDWWLSPELYLRRPPKRYPEYRIDALLKRKAEEGVMIYIVVYKEVELALTLD
ncbi:hypothetical protein CU098_002772, partial [Rhizopus stolonifer]